MNFQTFLEVLGRVLNRLTARISLRFFPGEAAGPGFPLSGHRGLGIGLVLDVYGNLSFSRISNFFIIGDGIDLDSKMTSNGSSSYPAHCPS